jgi:hypothetical protein
MPYLHIMSNKDALSRLDEISRQIRHAKSDKKIAITNLAQKTLTFLEEGNGKLDRHDRDSLTKIADAVVALGDRYFPPGDPDLADDEPTKEVKRLARGVTGRGAETVGKTRGGGGL